MDSHDVKPDGSLSSDQRKIVDALTDEQVAEIDAALLANCTIRRRKVAAVIMRTMTDAFMGKYKGVPDVYCVLRIRALVHSGALESFGDLNYMRYSEVRLPKIRRSSGAGPAS